METPSYFERGEHYACFRPVAHVSLKEGVDLISVAIAYCGDEKVPRLLVNIEGLTGYKLPETMDRYSMGAQFAAAAKFGLKVVLVAPSEVIDPNRFGVTVAKNRGLDTNVFSSEPEAVAWLLAQ